MIYLPDLDINDNCIEMNSAQVFGTVIISYITTAIFISILVLAIWNTYYFLYKLRKYQVYPLFLFYILSYTDIFLRIYHSFWMVTVFEYKQIFAVIGVMWTKVCIGITQVLVMTELTIRIEQSMRVYDVPDPSKMVRDNRLIDYLIYFCRVITTIVIVSVLSITIY